MIKKIFETGSKEVDDEDVVKTFLAEVVDVGNAGCEVSECVHYTQGHIQTYGSQPGFCRFDIHHAAEEHRFSLVPNKDHQLAIAI